MAHPSASKRVFRRSALTLRLSWPWGKADVCSSNEMRKKTAPTTMPWINQQKGFATNTSENAQRTILYHLVTLHMPEVYILTASDSRIYISQVYTRQN